MLLDDQARQVERDTGRVFCRHPREDLKAYGYAISRNRRRMNRRGRETFAMAVSSNSMNVARVTVIAISQGLIAFVWPILVESAMVPAALLLRSSNQMLKRPNGRKLKKHQSFGRCEW